MRKTPEILAPVGGPRQLIAAVRCGADAVYLGAKNFNARRNAENFEEIGLREAVSYCHARGVKVNVTFNTLVMDAETDELIETAREIAESGADAVITQDLAAAKLIRESCPGIELHASTQMSVHNLSGALTLEKLGFSRVVLARELTLEEIREICAGTRLDIEVFVHGALCVSLSGGCYLSSMLGGRSGNRGLCAQPCRLPFSSKYRDSALSLKDMSYIESIKKLAETGVSAFKIEGRMKRPEYVAAAVTACKTALDGQKPDMKTLEAVFSRSGFTDGYLTGKRDSRMFGVRTKDDADAAPKVFGELAGLFRLERSSVPADMQISLSPEKKAILSVSDGVFSVRAEGPSPDISNEKPADFDYLKRNLSKTGGTPFFLNELSAKIDDGLTMPPSSINAMRKDALEKLLEMRSKPCPHPFKTPEDTEKTRFIPENPPETRLRFESLSQIPENASGTLILPLAELAKNEIPLPCGPEKIIAELPALIYPLQEKRISQMLSAAKNRGISRILAENLGAVKLGIDSGMTVSGGHGLNILNTSAIGEYARLGLRDVTLSFELAAKFMPNLGGEIPRGVITYGFLPLMRFRACPATGKNGCGDCPGQTLLIDRKGVSFTVLCSGRQYSTLLNSVPLYAADKNFGGISFRTLYFTKETPADCEKIIRLHRENGKPDFSRTTGLYFRELL